jgi:hypothetical protein
MCKVLCGSELNGATVARASGILISGLFVIINNEVQRSNCHGNLYEVSDETVKYGREFCGTSTQECLLWQGQEAIVQVNYRPVLSSERALQNNKHADV